MLNRQALLAAAQGNSDLLTRTAKDLGKDGRRAITRAARYMLLGTLIAAAVGWALVRIYGKRNRYTELRVQLKPDGKLGSVAVYQPSGLDFLDDEAIEAFKEAAPFPNPPESHGGGDT